MDTLDEVRRSLPDQPGVYRFFDKDDRLLYVGKARRLKRRVNSYFRREHPNPRLNLLVSRLARLEVTLTASESEALLLESNLIKRFRPPFNIVFRDDKSYPYLQLTDHAFPRLTYFRGTPHGKHRYFGPYPHASAAREVIQILQKIFLLRTCEDSVFRHRTRPCLLHQIGRCSAPCVERVTVEEYAAGVRQTIDFLQGKESLLRQQWSEAMGEAALRLDYEAAARWRDRIAMVQSLLTSQSVATGRAEDADVIAVLMADDGAVVNLTMIRQGRHCGDRNLFPNVGLEEGPADILAAFLMHHYADHGVVPLLISPVPCPSESIRAWLAERAGGALRWVHAPRGVQRAWLEAACRNAEGALTQQRLRQSSQARRLESLQALLDLPATPGRIECFDISHHRGSATVASCVVFEGGQAQKSAYRRYHIDGITPGDDYGAMASVLERRFRAMQEDGLRPDLILIDGGAGQLKVAQQVMREAGIELPMAGIAKGPERQVGAERIHLPDRAEPLTPDLTSPGFQLILAVRDEAHRFAVAGHHQRQRREQAHSPLDDVPGVGDKRKRLLLSTLGGLRALENAAEQDIARVPGNGTHLAHAIFDALHDDGKG